MIGEATPRYTRRDLYPCVVDRIKKFNPEFKFVHIARDPYEKLVSFWRMWARTRLKCGKPYPGIDEFHSSYENIAEIIRSCMYEYQLAVYLAAFPENQFHFILTEDLRTNERLVIEGLIKFLD